jgi:hypothetical protein
MTLSRPAGYSRRQNNALKRNHLARHVGFGLPLNAVFGGHSAVTAMTRRPPSRSRRLSVALLALSAVACPYESPIEPAGRSLPLRASLVGAWACSTEEDPDWAIMTIGWIGETSYSLTLRPTKPATEPDANDVPWVTTARPLSIGGHEIWSVGSEDAPDLAKKFSFVRIVGVTDRMLKLGWLGNNTALSARFTDESPETIARTLADPKETVIEGYLTCRRTQG